MYNNGISPEWNVSLMFPELQKSNVIVINTVISELDYILIGMTGASQNIRTGAQSRYHETSAQHNKIIFPFLYIKKRKLGKNKQPPQKNPKPQTQTKQT